MGVLLVLFLALLGVIAVAMTIGIAREIWGILKPILILFFWLVPSLSGLAACVALWISGHDNIGVLVFLAAVGGNFYWGQWIEKNETCKKIYSFLEK